MDMLLRSVAAVAAAVFLTAPGFAEPPKPVVIAQSKPVSRQLAELREMIRHAAGPGADKVLKELDNGIKGALGEQGFEGIDVNRPLGAYVVLSDDITSSSAVIVVPITGEKEFVGFLERMKLKTE